MVLVVPASDLFVFLDRSVVVDEYCARCRRVVVVGAVDEYDEHDQQSLCVVGIIYA